MGVEAFEAECVAKAEARASQEAARAAGALSKKEQKNRDFWQRRKDRKKAVAVVVVVVVGAWVEWPWKMVVMVGYRA